jgi:oligoribonuclease (3'-5' exoribonuclease)
VAEGISNPNDMSNIFNYSNSYSAVWIWLDIETSGLDPTSANFGILEIAAVVTDTDLTVIDTFHVIVHQYENVLSSASKWCQEHFCARHFGGNDLFDQCRNSAVTEKHAGEMLRQFIIKHSVSRSKKHFDDENDPKRNLFQTAEFNNNFVDHDDHTASSVTSTTKKKINNSPANPQTDVYRVMLAGCSVYFDRSVLLHRYPYLGSLVGHKTIDMSSVLEIARRFRPDLLGSLQNPQRSHRALQDVFESLNVMKWFFQNILMNTR